MISKEAHQLKLDRLKAQVYKALVPAIVSSMLLTGCVPEGGIIEVKPAVTQAIDSAEPAPEEETTELGTDTVIASPTLENTPTQAATATPEKTEEERMHEYCIKRAKEVGIDLENFANSNNLWVTEHQGLAGLEEAFNTSFTDDRTFKTMIVVGYDSLNSQSRYDKAQTTAEGRKIMGWLEAIYKKADGNYQLVLLPTHIWDIKSELMWDKSPDFGGPRFDTEINSKAAFKNIINNYSSPDYNPDYKYAVSLFANYIKQGIWVGSGAFINFDSDYPDSEAGGAGTLEEPGFTAEEHAQFQQIGEVSIFPYFLIDSNTKLKQPIIYPFVNSASSSRTNNYANQTFIVEAVAWSTGDTRQWNNPKGPPFPRHWEKMP